MSNRDDLSEGVARCPKHVAVVTGVADDEDESGLVSVSQLQVDPSNERLNVSKARFNLDHDPTAGAVDHGIPRPDVAWTPERDLDSHPKARSEQLAQSAEQLELGGIAHDGSVLEGANRDVEPDDGSHQGERLVRNAGNQATLDAAQLAGRRAGRLRKLS